MQLSIMMGFQKKFNWYLKYFTYTYAYKTPKVWNNMESKQTNWYQCYKKNHAQL